MNIPVYNINGEKIEEKALSGKLTEVKISRALLHEVVIAYLANQRQGTACAKTRGEVSGGGAKPWKQKHTGRARAGSNRSPLFRKGGVVFGPRPRSYRQDLPKKKLRIALDMAIRSKIEDNSLFLVRDLKINDNKTKRVQQIINKLKLAETNVLFVIKEVDNNFKLAIRNIPKAELLMNNSLNAYSVLRAKTIIFSENAFEKYSN
ncbi:MAG: 50S ribosomal protein L4 [Elusimicrobia bacterium RIFOXYA2_FULL_39_19]|nr:MAG: 50S ribosomal protein L4 [Elusimicrobia bacterium RIFOXYA2_FULL_39_19]